MMTRTVLRRAAPWIALLSLVWTSVPVARAGLVTLYDATQITGLANGSSVTSLTDLSGNGNAATQSPSASGVGTYVADGIGGLASIQFTRDTGGGGYGIGTGYQSAQNMGTAFGISGDSAWTMIYVFRAQAPASYYSWVGSLGSGLSPHAAAIAEIDATNSGKNPSLELATGFADDVQLSPGNSFDQLAGKDLVLTVIHQGPGAGSISDTTQIFVNGDAPGQGILAGLSLGTTGDAATAVLNLANEPFFLGGSPFGTGAGFDGLLSEALVYNNALGAADRTAIETQLMSKFHIASVPEPASWLMGCIGLAAIGGVSLVRRRPAD